MSAEQLSILGRLIASKLRPTKMAPFTRPPTSAANALQFLQQHDAPMDMDELAELLRKNPGVQLPPDLLKQIGERMLIERRMSNEVQLPLQGEGFAGGGSARKSDLTEPLRAMAGMYGSLGRGALSTLLGAPGDLTRLGYTLMGQEEPARGTTLFPDSSDMRRMMPNLPASMRNPTYETLGTFDPFTPTAGAKLLPKAIPALRGALSKFAEEMVSHPSASRKGQQGVVKLPGGNWLNGSVEDSLRDLKRPIYGEAENLPENAGRASLNNWIDSKLTRYVKNDMATERDPIHALAEQGIIHQSNLALRPDAAEYNRQFANKMQKGTGKVLGKSELAKAWESAADSSIFSNPAESYPGQIFKRSPWLKSIDPKAPVHELISNRQDLGFDHLIDVLNHRLQAGELTPEALNRVSVPGAVRMAHAYNAAQAKKMEAARLAAQQDMSIHKDYGDGMRWVELKRPESVSAEGYVVAPHEFKGRKGFIGVDPSGKPVTAHYADAASAQEHLNGIIKSLPDKKLQDWLTQEGDAMGHCVGDYCSDVLSGNTRIFSLRDAKGEPHVTIETNHQKPFVSGEAINKIEPELFEKIVDEGGHSNLYDWLKNNRPKIYDQFNKPKNDIVQIKGKQNRKPNDAYLPYVQDFVKSGKWGDVGDLGNTGLKHFPEEKEIAPGVVIPKGFHTQNDISYLLKEAGVPDQNISGWIRGEGFATGGSIPAWYEDQPSTASQQQEAPVANWYD